MKKLKAIVIDDEPNNIEVLEILLRDNNDVDIICSALDAYSGIDLINQLDPDLVFLDVEMPGRNGFEVLKAFDSPRFKVVFVTAYNQYAIKAIKYSAIDYLLKPLDVDELLNAIENVKKSFLNADTRINSLNEIKANERYDKIVIGSTVGFDMHELDNIVHLESMQGNMTMCYFINGNKKISSKPLKHYESILPKEKFCRIHRSSIINLKNINNYNSETGEIHLKSEQVVLVAFRRRGEFKKLIKKLFY